VVLVRQQAVYILTAMWELVLDRVLRVVVHLMVLVRPQAVYSHLELVHFWEQVLITELPKLAQILLLVSRASLVGRELGFSACCNLIHANIHVVDDQILLAIERLSVVGLAQQQKTRHFELV
jgi:hypothetical protein